MKTIGIILAVLVGGFALIIGIGSTLPETEASRARNNCDNLRRTAYTAAEKAQADEICALLHKEADRKMGRIPADAP